MPYSNIKISSSQIAELKELTGEKTGQKAVHMALLHFLQLARQRNITEVLKRISFEENYQPIKLRKHER